MPYVKPEILKATRKKRGLSQEKLAKNLGVSKRQIAEWERLRGKKPPVSIREGNFKKLCQILGVTEGQLTGLEPTYNADDHRSDARARLTSLGHLNYELIEHKYGVSKNDLIEVAPLLFEILAQQSLEWRRHCLSDLRRALDVLREDGAPLEPRDLEKELNEYGVALESETRAIERGEVFSPSRVDPLFDIHFSNRFFDFINDSSQHFDVSFDICAPVPGFPEYLLFPKLLKEIAGGLDEPLMPKAAYALTTGRSSLKKIPTELQGPERSSERCAWLAQQVPNTEGEVDENYVFFDSGPSYKLL